MISKTREYCLITFRIRVLRPESTAWLLVHVLSLLFLGSLCSSVTIVEALDWTDFRLHFKVHGPVLECVGRSAHHCEGVRFRIDRIVAIRTCCLLTGASTCKNCVDDTVLLPVVCDIVVYSGACCHLHQLSEGLLSLFLSFQYSFRLKYASETARCKLARFCDIYCGSYCISARQLHLRIDSHYPDTAHPVHFLCYESVFVASC